MNEAKAARYHRRVRRGRALAVSARAGVLLAAVGSGFPPNDLATALAVAFPALPAAAGVPLAAALAALALACAAETAALPFMMRVEFALERRYRLSSEPLAAWLRRHFQTTGWRALGWAVSAGAVYTMIGLSPAGWWMAAPGAFLVVTVTHAALAPLLLTSGSRHAAPLRRPALRTRIEALARRAGTPVIDIREWRSGQGSGAANAAVVGIGPSRRILVSKALLDDYSDDEIEVVIAHELGHHVHRDLWQAIGCHAVLWLAAFWLADVAMTRSVPGLPAVGDPAGLPLLALVVGAVFVVSAPLGRLLSRWHEGRADRFAIAVTGKHEAFVSGLRRLGAQHLAEEQPSRLVEWLFYSHPPVEARMAAARAVEPKG